MSGPESLGMESTSPYSEKDFETKEYEEDFGHQVEDFVKELFESISGVEVIKATDLEDQKDKIDLKLKFGYMDETFSAQVTVSSNPETIKKKREDISDSSQHCLIKLDKKEVANCMNSEDKKDSSTNKTATAISQQKAKLGQQALKQFLDDLRPTDKKDVLANLDAFQKE